MSYQKYHTHALILRSFPRGDSDRVFVLYTEQFGLIYASARGARAEHSKMRYALTDYARVSISLVRGKASWRIAGAQTVAVLPSDATRMAVFGRLANLTVRLIPGVEDNPLLYETLAAAHVTLREDGTDIEALEVLAVLRILHSLGYIAPAPDDLYLVRSNAFDTEATGAVRTAFKRFLQQTNEALAESQL